MNDQKPTKLPLPELDSLEQDDPHCEEITRRLMEADFSLQSSLREPLRERLEQRMQASQSSSWLEKLGFILPRMETSTPIKVALLVMALLARVLIAPSPLPAVTDLSQPLFLTELTTSASAPPATVESTAFAAYQPIPIPTPGVEVLYSSATSGLQTVSTEADGVQTDAVTPQPTPLAPLTLLP